MGAHNMSLFSQLVNASPGVSIHHDPNRPLPPPTGNTRIDPGKTWAAGDDDFSFGESLDPLPGLGNGAASNSGVNYNVHPPQNRPNRQPQSLSHALNNEGKPMGQHGRVPTPVPVASQGQTRIDPSETWA